MDNHNDNLYRKRVLLRPEGQYKLCSLSEIKDMYSFLLQSGGSVYLEETRYRESDMCRCTGYRPILDAFKSLSCNADPKYENICVDIEELGNSMECSKTGEKCNRIYTNDDYANVTEIHILMDDDSEWHKVFQVNKIFKIFSNLDEKPYMLVAGNTSHGVYRCALRKMVLIDINHVKELHEYSLDKEKFTLGANINLTLVMNIFGEVSKIKGYEYCEELRKHIGLIGIEPVRNAGTLAGNLSIKHAHNEFPSDIYLILATVGAELTIISANNQSKTVSMEEYLQTDMNQKIILNIIFKPIDPETHKFCSYKIMPRPQNANGYINVGFLFEFDILKKNKILSCKICYGGINPSFLHAYATEKYLVNKEFHRSETVENAIEILSNELKQCIKSLDPLSAYRRKLAMSLFYKFILHTCPKERFEKQLKSGSFSFESLSNNVQNIGAFESRCPLTKPNQILKVSMKCCDEKKYDNDIPCLPRQLWAAFVQSERCHGKIKSIDPSKALAIHGVKYFFSAKDISGINSFTPCNMMMMQEEEEIFCSETVKYHGQPVGIILAQTFELANIGTKYVEIEYEDDSNLEKQIIPTIKDANDEPKTEIKNFGNIIKGHFEMNGQYHFAIETQTTLCVPNGDYLNVYVTAQWIDLLQAAISQCLCIPENCINLQVRRLGGAYGAKISRTSQIACACAIGAKLSNHPVRFVMSLESNMTAIGKRFGLISDYEVCVDEKGKIQKLNNTFSQDYGCSANESVVFATLPFFANCYDPDTFKVDSNYVLTDSASNTWCRAPGTTEGIAMIENIMEHIAYETGLDPIAVRLENMMESCKMKTLLPEFLQSCEFESRRNAVDAFNKENCWRKRGIAVVPMQYPQEFFGTIPVMVSIYHTDGTVAITHGGIECGQGINLKIALMVAKTLNVQLNYINVKSSLKNIVRNSSKNDDGVTDEAVICATIKACETLLQRMKPVREDMGNPSWASLIAACHGRMIDLNTVYYYKNTDVQRYTTWDLCCAEVEIDCLTGNLFLRRVDILEDTGESISPWVDVKQIEEAFIMGLGYWLTESSIYDEESGELLINRTWSYKLPDPEDIPTDFRIELLRNSSNTLTVLQSKAINEPALCMSIVAIFALRYALESAREDAGIDREWFNLGSLTTIEKNSIIGLTDKK